MMIDFLYHETPTGGVIDEMKEMDSIMKLRYDGIEQEVSERKVVLAEQFVSSEILGMIGERSGIEYLVPFIASKQDVWESMQDVWNRWTILMSLEFAFYDDGPWSEWLPLRSIKRGDDDILHLSVLIEYGLIEHGCLYEYTEYKDWYRITDTGISVMHLVRQLSYHRVRFGMTKEQLIDFVESICISESKSIYDYMPYYKLFHK